MASLFLRNGELLGHSPVRNVLIVVNVSTFDNEIIQTGLYISIRIPHPNYRQNFSRAKIYLLLIKTWHMHTIQTGYPTLFISYIYIVKGKNPFSNEKKYMNDRPWVSNW